MFNKRIRSVRKKNVQLNDGELFVYLIQSVAVLVIGVYAFCSLGLATSAHLRGAPFALRERGTPLLRSFGDWAPFSLRLLMTLRRAAVFAVAVLLLIAALNYF